MSYPTTLDTFNNPTPSNNLDDPTVLHTDQHTNINNAVTALETKVGVDSSAVTSTLDYKVTNLVNQNTPANVVTVGPAGTGATYTTIQNALDALTSGGVIRVLAQNITVSSTLLYKYNNTVIEGVYNNTVIQCDATSVTTLLKANVTGLTHCGLKNIRLSNTAVSVAGTGLDLSNMALFVLERVDVVNFSTGLNLNDTANITFYNAYRDLYIYGADTGIKIDSTNPVNMNLFENIRIAVNASGTALHMTQGQGNVFQNLDCEPLSTTSTTGITLGNAGTGVVDTTFIGAWVEGNALGASVNSNVLRTKFIGCTFFNTSNFTDSSSSTMYLSCRNQNALKNDQIGLRLPVINGSTINGLEIYLNSSTASNRGINIVNDVNFAQTGALVYAKTVNVSDSANVAQLVNAGTGFNILSQDGGSNNTFTVASSGNVRSLGSIVSNQFTLTDAATVTIDASKGNSFYLAAGGDRTLAIPTNPTQGQTIILDHFASGGARTLTLTTSGAGSFRFGSDITGITQTASGKNDYITCRYNSTDSKWDVIGSQKGY